jgi:NAD(P)H-hydrate epimerase
MLRLTRQQIREVDRRAIEEYGIPSILLMENASRAVADAACEMLDGNCVGEILILVGPGNNGGDGLAAARHLANRGADITIALLSDPGHFKGDALINWNIAQAMKIRTVPATEQLIESEPTMLMIDALFGTGLNRPPADPFPAIVKAVKHSNRPVLAVDLPSGLDCDTGKPLGPCIHATQTVTFVAHKIGFASESAQPYLGRVTVADIGAPRELIDAIAHNFTSQP